MTQEEIKELIDNIPTKRREFKERIHKFTEHFKSIRALQQHQYDLHRIKNDLIDYKWDITIAIKTLSKALKKLREQLINAHRTGIQHDYKAHRPYRHKTETEMKTFVENDLSNNQLKIDRLEIQLEFISDSIAQCTDMIYGIDYAIKMNKIVVGGNN